MEKEKISNSFITKNDSKALYGIAILFMVFHHCFCIPDRLNYDYIPVLRGFEFESKVAYIGKLCVAIYAFVSGYALTKTANSKEVNSVSQRFENNLRLVGRQLIHFYSKFWLVCLIFIPIGILFFDKQWSAKDVIWACLFGARINTEWWYVKQYLFLLFVFPLIDCFLFCLVDKKKILYCIILLFAVFFLVLGCKFSRWEGPKHFLVNLYYNVNIDYMIIFLCAVLISKFKIFEKIDLRIALPFYFYVLLLLGVFLFRWRYVKGPAQSNYDIYLTPVFIFALVKLLHEKKMSFHAQNVLQYFGKYSTFMWLTHTFWIYYYFQKIILLPKYSLLIYVWAVAIALVNAIVLDMLYKRIETLILGKNKNIIKN